MRIAFVVQPWDDTIPEIGGYSSIPIISYQLALQLSRCGHEIITYGKKSKDLPALEQDANGILHIRVSTKPDDFIRKPFRLLERLGIFRNTRRPLFASNLYSLVYSFQIAIELRKRKPDIVHIFNFSQYVPMIRVFNPNAKFVLHMQCEWLTQLDHQMIEKRLRNVDMISGCSEYITGKVSQRFPEHSNHCHTIYNGVDLSKFTKKGALSIKHDAENNILFVGRVSPEKGVHVLLDAFGRVLKTFPDSNLQIVGGIGSAPIEFMVGISDDERVRDLSRFYDGFISKHDDYYNQLLTRLPANQMQKVTFVGSIPHTQIHDAYLNADIFINSSLTEALGIPILEAMASGVPVIGSEVGGIPELIRHGETGLLFRPGDHESLAESIIRLIKEKNLRQSLKRKAFQEIRRRYSWEYIAEELINEYQLLLDA